ncbi:MAG TPA: DUF362 domain-containing protein [Tepidisphaeraceae bacterium]|nr:DUF362 domain-containing protein [Tepidisphaeraceae bacterium]
MSAAKAQVETEKATPSNAKTAEVLFAPAAIERLEVGASLPVKFQRMLDQFPMQRICQGAVVAVKVHVGVGMGFTTIPPLFIRLLIQKIKEAGAKSVFVTDGSLSIAEATARGYTAEVLGAPLLGAAGFRDRFFYKHKVDYQTLKEIEVCGNIEDADTLINISHFKGHGDCGYGGACKNLAMGCVTQHTRGALHHLEGGLVYEKERCTKCRKCVHSCTRDAARWNKEADELEIFYHHCVYCRHCVLACPQHAIKITGGGFVPFQHGLAMATREVLKTFDPQRVLHINFLTQITVYCDCWGFSSPALIPDVGILASEDIVAVDKASLDMTRDGQPLPGSLPKGRELVEGTHLFERIHGKDPYVQVEQMQAVGLGTTEYRLREIR